MMMSLYGKIFCHTHVKKWRTRIHQNGLIAKPHAQWDTQRSPGSISMVQTHLVLQLWDVGRRHFPKVGSLPLCYQTQVAQLLFPLKIIHKKNRLNDSLWEWQGWQQIHSLYFESISNTRNGRLFERSVTRGQQTYQVRVHNSHSNQC